MLRELNPIVGFEIHATFGGPVDSSIPDQIAEHLLAVIREAVTNVGRHAGATEASVRLTVDEDLCRLQVTDNGCGIAMSGNNGGFGLPNLLRRAEKLHGRFTIDSPPTGGTSLTWEVPVAQ